MSQLHQDTISDAQLYALSAAVIDKVINAELRLATAESCTGGFIAKCLTDIPGSSAAYPGGIVSYANNIKQDRLGVPEKQLIQYGAVSREVAISMAENAKNKFDADIAIAVTGIAGPGGATPHKPVGLVFMAIAQPNAATEWHRLLFENNGRDFIRRMTVRTALERLSEILG